MMAATDSSFQGTAMKWVILACAAQTGAAAQACVAKSEAIARKRTCANLDVLPPV
jgi:hypothetical protein